MANERISVVQGDITLERVDAIVNAANSSLLGGGGVDGAIHRAAGPKLLTECRRIGGCDTGEAVVTGGYRLPAKWVIHTVGPVWHGGGLGEAELLTNCYRNALRLAVENGARTVAFPSISTGAYRYPVDEASRIAIRTVSEFLSVDDTIEEVRFVCFDTHTYSAYLRALAEHLGTQGLPRNSASP